MAHSSSCSQMETKLDWRSIYSRLVRRGASCISSGRGRGARAEQGAELRRQTRHFELKHDSSRGRRGRRETKFTQKRFPFPHGSEKKKTGRLIFCESGPTLHENKNNRISSSPKVYSGEEIVTLSPRLRESECTGASRLYSWLVRRSKENKSAGGPMTGFRPVALSEPPKK